MVPAEIIHLFHAKELQHVIGGMNTLDDAALVKMKQSASGEKHKPSIRLFWNVMESMSPVERLRVYAFVSGNLTLPIHPKPLKLSVSEKDHFYAHACFNSCDIPKSFGLSGGDTAKEKLSHARIVLLAAVGGEGKFNVA